MHNINTNIKLTDPILPGHCKKKINKKLNSQAISERKLFPHQFFSKKKKKIYKFTQYKMTYINSHTQNLLKMKNILIFNLYFFCLTV